MIDGKKLHWLSLVSYAKEIEVQEVLKQKSDRYQYANYIVHDSDTITETDIKEWQRSHAKTEMCPWTIGAAKPYHIHILLGFEQERKFAEVRNWFKKCIQDDGSVANTFAERCEDPADYKEYEKHETAQAKKDGKYQYKEEDIKILKGEDIELPHRKLLKQEEKAEEQEELLEDILKKVPMREMCRKYGRDYMKNWKSYREYALIVKLEETGELDETLASNPIADYYNKKMKNAFEMGYKSKVAQDAEINGYNPYEYKTMIQLSEDELEAWLNQIKKERKERNAEHRNS